MSLRTLSLALLLALVSPAVVHADAVYFSQAGANGIQSVSGTIVKETSIVLEIVTADGRTVSIPRGNVYQIVRDASSSAGHSDVDPGTLFATGAGRLGVKGGMNISNMSVDPQSLEDENSLQSFALGIWWGFPVTRRLTIQPEALYSMKGDSESAGGYTSSTHLGYIDVPVLAKIGFMHGSTARPSLILGPLLAMNISASSKFEGDDSSIDVDVKDQIRPMEFGFVIGGGVEFPVGERVFGVELRYSKGLSNFADESANGSGRNDVLAIMGSIGVQ